MEESIHNIELKQFVFEKYMDNRTVADKYLIDSITTIQQKGNETQTEVSTLNQRLSQLETKVIQLEEENKTLKETMEKQIKERSDEIEKMNQRYSLLDSILKDVVKSLEEMKSQNKNTLTPVIEKKEGKEITEKIQKEDKECETNVNNEIVFKKDESNENDVLQKTSPITETAKTQIKDEEKQEIEVDELEEELPIDKELKSQIEQISTKKVIDVIYKGTEDGFSAEEFNRCVGSYKNILFVIKTTKNEVFGGYCSDVPVVDDIARGVFGDKNHFVFTIKNNVPIKFVKREVNSYSTWLFPDDSENILCFAGAFLISGNCGENEESRLSGNFKREYEDNGQTIIDHQNFRVSEFFAIQLE
ncbi:hypothetical protein EDI_338740 [Entamoeba dispar SAW760]|uniref:TLDc domain-containing protein n=1 Tax=Entamoeba dispar (strain ATCC PRA-260 / SAW760) TaxID=370354 RepID=B0E7T3_ENTDS|nr:uncharacterized protein EDI_338740 [Entamoeba dispar SAW760]EDR29405.1 hypothetical protein EDI_338740 [Entamoeba dispar SAW760]|eukprot:EDR29405.1 hypothetical protein EDI_338740 [Entamoeba dispar SAW760]